MIPIGLLIKHGLPLASNILFGRLKKKLKGVFKRRSQASKINGDYDSWWLSIGGGGGGGSDNFARDEKEDRVIRHPGDEAGR